MSPVEAEPTFPVDNSFDHGPMLLKQAMKMRKTEELVDILLVVDGEEFKAHKLILASFSDYFQAMFCRSMSAGKSRIELRNLTPQSFDLLLEYMYTGKIEITENNVEDLFRASSLLLMDQIKNQCDLFMCLRMTKENCIGMWAIALEQSSVVLASEAKRLIDEHFDELCKTSDFLLLPFAAVRELIESDSLCADSENIIAQAIIDWTSHDLAQRRDQFYELLTRLSLYDLDTTMASAMRKLAVSIGDDHSVQMLLERAVKEDALCCPTDPYNAPHRRHRYHREVLVSVGGVTCEIYHVDTDQWYPFALITTRHCYGLAALDDKIFVAGGSREWKRTRSLQVFDPSLDYWKELSPMSTARSNLTLVNLDGTLYAVGGYDGQSPLR